MARQPGTDVIVVADRDPTAVEPCLQNLLAHAGPHLRRLIVVDDESADPNMPEMLDRLAGIDSRLHVVRNSERLARVRSYNRGLEERQGDAVLVSSDCVVGAHWLSELSEVAHSSERTACAVPLTNGHGTCSVSVMGNDAFSSEIAEATVREACASLPRWVNVPNVNGACIFLRGEFVDAVGLLNGSLASLEEAIKDWVWRASLLGFTARRANRVYAHRSRLRGDRSHNRGPRGDNTQGGDQGQRPLEHQLNKFQKSLDGRLPAHAVRVQSTGRLRVAYDIRHLPREQVGTRTYAVCLGQRLSEIREIDLTLLVRQPAQAEGMSGRVITSDQWQDDVEVIHKPAQVIAPGELKLLFDSSAHVIMTYQDLIGYQIPSSFSSDLQHDHYRGTSGLSMQAVQRVIAYSESAGQEITAEFGIPAEEICVVPLGAEAAWFGQRKENDGDTCRKLGVAAPFFFSIATDFPHKNLPNLLDAYAMLRSRWRAGEPPRLVLAGHTSGARTDFYPRLESTALPAGVTFLGTVTRDQLRVLYQQAMALVFPSLYEGFGLPPLEAMAAGTPVIAMRISAVPEVGGDAVLYADGLSVASLARAMESVATSSDLRAELRRRGLNRIEEFSWDQTARATVDVYRSAVLRPSRRSLEARRLLRDAIIRWSEPRPVGDWLEAYDDLDLFTTSRPIGIKNAFRALNVSLHSRLRRELKRLRSHGRRSA
jgi:glycosyltransferase involved in cell wall biosynthesis/GT2 family glycosyltransferase